MLSPVRLSVVWL